MKRAFIVLLGCILLATAAYAQDKGTAKEAQALVKKAITYYKENGQVKTVAAIADFKGPFMKKDLYVFIYDTNGICVMHPYMKSLNGISILSGKDADGKAFNKELVDMGNTSGSGWVDYRYLNQKTKKIVPKTAYVEKVDKLIFIAPAEK